MSSWSANPEGLSLRHMQTPATFRARGHHLWDFHSGLQTVALTPLLCLPHSSARQPGPEDVSLYKPLRLSGPCWFLAHQPDLHSYCCPRPHRPHWPLWHSPHMPGTFLPQGLPTCLECSLPQGPFSSLLKGHLSPRPPTAALFKLPALQGLRELLAHDWHLVNICWVNKQTNDQTQERLNELWEATTQSSIETSLESQENGRFPNIKVQLIKLAQVLFLSYL